MNHTEVFFSMKRVSYSVETKYKAVEMKAAGFSTKTRLLIPCKIQRMSSLEHSVFIKFSF